MSKIATADNTRQYNVPPVKTRERDALGRYAAQGGQDTTRHSAQKMRWYWDNHDRSLEIQRKNRMKAKLEAIAQYGGKCMCCGEERHEFLCIDHINGGGNQHQRETGSGKNFHIWLRKRDWPEGFQVLCHNCNFAKTAYGSCPHSLK